MSKRLITVRSGKEEIQMEVTEEQYQRYYRPWWQQKKREQRNREAMEEHGFREESYEEWKENDMKSEFFLTVWKNWQKRKRYWEFCRRLWRVSCRRKKS